MVYKINNLTNKTCETPGYRSYDFSPTFVASIHRVSRESEWGNHLLGHEGVANRDGRIWDNNPWAWVFTTVVVNIEAERLVIHSPLYWIGKKYLLAKRLQIKDTGVWHVLNSSLQGTSKTLHVPSLYKKKKILWLRWVESCRTLPAKEGVYCLKYSM